MKKKTLIAFISTLFCSIMLVGCGTSEEAQAVIDKINTIGEVDYDDEQLIGECEEAYLLLTDEQKSEVSNLDALSKARIKMDELIAARPIPFSEANWETTQTELIEIYGKPSDEHDNDYYGHMLWYENVENEGYKGIAKYGFENGKLTRVFFSIEGYDEKAEKHFLDMFQTKYGDPEYNDDYGNKRWEEDNCLYCVQSGTTWGGYVNVIYMSPDLIKE